MLHDMLTRTQKSFNDQSQAELSQHPELAELEDPSAKDSSVAPTSVGTPQASGGTGTTRIKLVTNGTSQANGGANSVHSDGD